MATRRGYTHRIFLDSKFSRRDAGGNHWIGSQIKGWRFAGSNAKSFRLFIVPDASTSSGLDATPIHLIKVFNYMTPAESGCFENDTPQPNVWVDIFICPEDEIVFTPTDEESGGSVTIGEGSIFANDNKLVNDTGTVEICNNDTERVISEIYNYSANTVYIGTLAAVGDVSYQDLCVKIRPGESYLWRIKLSLFARTETGLSSNLNIMHKKAA